MFKTRRGEISVHAKKVTPPRQALEPLPEKYHGLKDRSPLPSPLPRPRDERRGDGDLQESAPASSPRIREYLDERGLHSRSRPPSSRRSRRARAARPFVTKSNALDLQLYLRIATELYLKRA